MRMDTRWRSMVVQSTLRITGFVFALVAFPRAVFAAGSPWEIAVNAVATSVQGPIAKGLSLVAIVIGGLTWSLDESGGSRRMLAGIIFGCGMALGATSFMVWLFG